MASRSIIYRSRRLRQIIDLRDTDKSQYFAITELNNCFIIRSPSLFFQWISLGSESICHFHARAIAKKLRRRKHGFLYAWAEYYLQPNTFTGEKCLIGRRATTWHCQIQNGGNTSIVCLFRWKEGWFRLNMSCKCISDIFRIVKYVNKPDTSTLP